MNQQQKAGADLIREERDRQIAKEGYTPEHDDEHEGGELAMAAACYAAPERIYTFSPETQHVGSISFVDPFPWRWDKRYTRESGNMLPDPSKYGKRKRIDLLVKAGALIAAEIDRLLRTKRQSEEETPVQP